MSAQRSSRFVVACPDCEVDRRTDDPHEVVAFFRRHRSVTGHEPAFEAADAFPEGDVDLDDLPLGNGGNAEEDEVQVKDVVRALEPAFDDGVPVGIVAAAMHGRGVTIAETLDRIYEVRMCGGIYEPRDGNVRAF